MRFRSVVILAMFLVASLAIMPGAAAAEGPTQDQAGPAGDGGHEAHEGGHEKDFGAGGGLGPGRDTEWRKFAPCVRGMAANTYPCDGIDMMSRVPLEDLGLSFTNDIWGWTDPLTRRDYALVGGIEGVTIVDINQPIFPKVIGTLPTHSVDDDFPFWRAIKVVADHMFVVSEGRGHGLQIFDLTEVRNVKWWQGPVTFEETAHYDGFDTAHEIESNEDTGFVYVVGARDADRTLNCDGGLHMLDVSEPADPQFSGCFGDHGYIHDTQCVIYEGPDTRYQGQEICFISNAPGPFMSDDHWVVIADVTDKDDVVTLSRETYDLAGYSHQGWLTEDQGFFLHNDEGDELRFGLNTVTRVWDVRDLENPFVSLLWEHPETPSIAHNIFIRGDRSYHSNYTSGLRIYDVSRVGEPALSEVGYFDVFPENDDPTFDGTWSNYPFFRQRNIVAVSSMDRGLFILRPRGHVLN
jgi:choice-of-anchor B domain-containing protein